MNLSKISQRLADLALKYAEVYPKFTLAENNYINKKAQIMLAQQGLASQPLRDSAVDVEIAQTPEYEEYMTLLPEIQVINTQIRIYNQISKNMISASWGETDYK